MSAAPSRFVCPCGCGLQLSQKDAAMERWLAEIAGQRIGDELRINLATSRQSHASSYPDEPLQILECRCGARVEAFAYIAEFLDRHGMGAPSCQRCRDKRRPS